ncbi:hypothetical protein IAT38_004155 [Cryptococcus sp. DSM 104549]
MVGILRTLVVGAGAVFGSALFYQAHHSLSTTSQHISRAHTTYKAQDSLDRVLAAGSAPDGPLGVASLLYTISTHTHDDPIVTQVDSFYLGAISPSLVIDYLREWWSVAHLTLASTLSSLLEEAKKHTTPYSVYMIEEAFILYIYGMCCYILTLVAGILRGVSQDSQQQRLRRRRRPAKNRRTAELLEEDPEDADVNPEDLGMDAPALDLVKVLQKRLAAAQRSATEQMRRNKPSRTQKVKPDEAQLAKATTTFSASSTAVAVTPSKAVTPPKAVTPHTVMTPLAEAPALLSTKKVAGPSPLPDSNKAAGSSLSNKAASAPLHLSKAPTATPAPVPSPVSAGKAANTTDAKVVKSLPSRGRYGIPPESHESQQATPARSPSKPPVVLPCEEDVVMEDAEDDKPAASPKDDKPAVSRWSHIPPTPTDQPQVSSPHCSVPFTQPAAEANAPGPSHDVPRRSRFFSTWNRPEEGPSHAELAAPSAVTEEYGDVPDVYKAYAWQMEEREEEIRANMDAPEEEYSGSCHDDDSMASFCLDGRSFPCDEELGPPALDFDPTLTERLNAFWQAERQRSKAFTHIRILHWRLGLEVAREGLQPNDMLDWRAAEIKPRPTEEEDHRALQTHTRMCMGERRFEAQWGHPLFYNENRGTMYYPREDTFDIKPKHPGRHLQVLQRAADNLGKIIGKWHHDETTPRVLDATAPDFMTDRVQEEVKRFLIMARGLGFDVELEYSPQAITIDICPNRHFVHTEYETRFGPLPQVVTRAARIAVPHSVKIINAPQ